MQCKRRAPIQHRALMVACPTAFRLKSNRLNYLSHMSHGVFVDVHVALCYYFVMNRPRVLDMRAWRSAGEFVGYWVYIGECVVEQKHGRTMLSDYAPYNFSGDVVAASLGRRKKRTADLGYWKIHVPRLGYTVDFHRQLLQDVLQDSAVGFDSHHLVRGRDCNSISNLEKKHGPPHRAGHGAEGGRRNLGKRPKTLRVGDGARVASSRLKTTCAHACSHGIFGFSNVSLSCGSEQKFCPNLARIVARIAPESVSNR